MENRTRVVNKNDEPYDVYIGRPSKWGNPFLIGRDGTREEVVEKFIDYFIEQIEVGNIKTDELKQLHGKRLGCFCSPKPCHGDIIAHYVEELCQQ